MAARSPGILLLPECPGGLESLMTVTPLSIDMAGKTPFLITNTKAFQTLSLMVHFRCMNDQPLKSLAPPNPLITKFVLLATSASSLG